MTQLSGRCEHAQCLLAQSGGSHSPIHPRETVLQKVTYDSAVYSNFHDLVHTLKSAIAPIDMHTPHHVDQIKNLLRRVRINEKEWQQYTNWKDNRYTRNLVGFDDRFTVLLLCWNKKQASPIHDHAGSSCWVKVLHGTLTETKYQGTPSSDGSWTTLEETGKVHAPCNEVCYINDSMGLHKMENESDSDVCVTLHIYSPPYQFCNAYNMDGTKRQVCMLAANAPYASFFDAEGTKCGAQMQQEGICNMGSVLRAIGPDPTTATTQLAVQKKPNEVNTEQEMSAAWKAAVLNALTQTVVTEQDWQRFTHFSDHRYTRSMVYSDDNFSVLLLCWMPGQSTPLHTHGKGTHSWFRVLCGTMDLNFFDAAENVTSTLTFDKESPSFFEGDGQCTHQFGNPSDACVAVTLHVYSPPYKQLTYDDPSTRGISTLPIVHCDETNPRRQFVVKSSTDDITLARTPALSASAGCKACYTSSIAASEIVFTNFSTLGEILNREFDTPRADNAARCAAVMSLMERCTFHDEEIDAMRSLRARVGNQLLLHKSHDFTVELVFWDRENTSSIHDHDKSNSWIKVLRGRLSEVTYRRKCPDEMTDDEKSGTGAALEVAHTALLMTDALSFLAKRAQHSLRNGGVAEAVSLHVTSPPADCSNRYTMCGKSVKQLFVFSGEEDVHGVPPMEPLSLQS